MAGGHFISLLSQICLSWNSPGYTRIKCFTEVEYTRAPSWVSAYEADLLEPIDLFYKELIRRLVESIDKRDTPNSWSATTPTASTPPSATGPVSQQAIPPTYSTKTSQPQDPRDPSPALSLLSQQLRKHPPAQFKSSRASMESVRPTAASVEQPNDSHALTVPIARRNKAAALIIQAMFPASIAPTKNMAIISEQAAAKNSSRVGDLVAKSDATAAILWTGLLKKGMSVFKTAMNRTAKVPFVTSDSEAVSMDHASKSAFVLSIRSSRVSDKSKSEIVDEETADSRLSSTATSCCSRARILRSTDGQQSGQQTSRPVPSYNTTLRIIFVIFAVGMAISAMNVWHLYSAVSSVVDMLQLNHGSIGLNDAAYEQHLVGIQYDTYRKQQHHYHEVLAPIQMQKELLRTEITELMLILDSARRSSKQDRDTKSQ
ncbi:hypothetical protein BGZ67_007555 [Mortierella alpina]|nr:hypothetical protein BGZ67_007555 [Mortierella alpina]